MKKEIQLHLYRIIVFGHELEKLNQFYTKHFGFELVEEVPDQWIVMKNGAMELAFHKIGADYEPKPGEMFKAESNTKLVFRIEGNLKDFREYLLEEGVIIGVIKSFEGIPALFCDGEDPEGNVFQLEGRTY